MSIIAKRNSKKVTGNQKEKNGGGKKKKVFSESLGKEHLLSLSRSIAEEESTKVKERVDRAREKSLWEKQKRAANAKSSLINRSQKEQTSANSIPPSMVKNNMSKGSIRAALLTKQREKSKRRKEARKEAAKKGISGRQASIGDVPDAEKKRKRVSFA